MNVRNKGGERERERERERESNEVTGNCSENKNHDVMSHKQPSLFPLPGVVLIYFKPPLNSFLYFSLSLSLSLFVDDSLSLK